VIVCSSVSIHRANLTSILWLMDVMPVTICVGFFIPFHWHESGILEFAIYTGLEE
jgi:hypothetical protein